MKKVYFVLASLAFLMLSTLSTANAATVWTVCASGCDFATIQAGVDGAGNGDTLTIYGETFVGNILITKDLTLIGAGPTSTVLDGNASSSVITIINHVTVNIHNLMITNGAAIDGGGIYNVNRSTLLIDNVLIENNSASQGGGIWNRGPIRLVNSTVKNNTATNAGGGIWNLIGNTTISHSTIENNVSNGVGGGIYNSIGLLKVKNSTVLNNSANTFGGGFHNQCYSYYPSDCLLIVSNSTISGNYANAGGGIVITREGAANIVNSTFYGNTADFLGNTFYLDVFSSTTLVNSIVARGNLPGPGETCDGFGSLFGQNNLIDDDSCGLPAQPVIGLDTVLANNGGPTPTHALLPGSNALHAGDNDICRASPVNNLDQRGFPRINGACDIGAFEFQPGE